MVLQKAEDGEHVVKEHIEGMALPSSTEWSGNPYRRPGSMLSHGLYLLLVYLMSCMVVLFTKLPVAGGRTPLWP